MQRGKDRSKTALIQFSSKTQTTTSYSISFQEAQVLGKPRLRVPPGSAVLVVGRTHHLLLHPCAQGPATVLWGSVTGARGVIVA